MKHIYKPFFTAAIIILSLMCINMPVSAQTGIAGDLDLPVIKVAFSDDQSIVTERVLYEALKRSGYQMLAKGTGMRTSIADVNYGDAAILPVQTDGFDRVYTNLIKVPVVIDYVEFSVYAMLNRTNDILQWSDLAGLRVGYRWQNEYITNNIRRTGAGGFVRVNDVSELWDSLLNGDTDAVILPRFSHYEHRFPPGVKRIGVAERQPVYSYVNSNYNYLVPLLENAYKSMIADGTMESIHKGVKPDGGKPFIVHINSHNAQNAWERSQMETIRSNLEAKTPLNYYSIYLNSNEPHSQVSYNSVISEMIRTETILRYPDLIIASGNEAFEFTIDNYYLLFPNLPVLFFGVYGLDSSVLYGLEDHFTGVCETVSFDEIIPQMLGSFPKTKRIFILNDNYLSSSIGIRESIKKELEAMLIKRNLPAEIIFNEDKPLPEILDDIRRFGSDTLVLIGNYFADSDGTFYTENDIQKIVSQASVNPVYSLTPSFIGYGTLGGFITSGNEKSKIITSMAAEILNGAKIGGIPVIFDSAFLNQWLFDNEIIKRFKISKKNLPKNRVLINRALPVWESNPYAFRLLLTIAALFLLIIIGFILFFLKNKKITQSISRQKELFETVNSVSSVLLEPEMNHRFDDTLLKAMDIMVEAVGVDRVCIWMRNDEPRLCFSLNYQWENGDFKSLNRNGELAPDIWFDAHPGWNDIMSQGKCINSLVKDMPLAEQEELAPRKVLSLFVVPIFIQDQFWGFVGFDGCKKERLFTNSEELILRSASRMIAHAIIRKEMTLQLENSAREANNANKAKSSFLANMSHEIRTPMNAILGIAEIQLRDENLSRETEEAIEKIYESGDLLLNIINDILDLSKIEAGKLELLPVKYDIPSLINDSVQLNRLRYDSKPIDLSIHVDENTPHYFYGDELRIKQVMNNILSNAFKYTDEGTVTIYISAELNESDADNAVLIFRICDTGQGMTETQLNELFNEYTRFNAEANRETVGTGLGMSITKHLLDLMRGEISVKSEPGKGTEFIVRLPQKRAGSEICGKEVSDKLRNFKFRSTTLTNKTQFLREYMPYGSVLVVDDVESNLYVAKGLLIPYGLKIDTSSSGFEAIDKIKAGNEYDVIFMDHMMPKMDGIEAVKIIRELGYLNPIVALTANALVGQSEIFLQNKFDGFISKPIDSRELNLLLNDLIRNKKPKEIVEAARQKQRDKEHTNTLLSQESVISPEIETFFIHDAQNAINVLDNLFTKINELDEQDVNLYITTVHGIKGALTNIKENELSALSYKLEMAGVRKDITVITTETPKLIDALKSLIEKFKSKKEDDENVKISDELYTFLKEKLKEIKTACGVFNVEDAKSALTEIKKRKWPSNIKIYLDEISMNLLHSAFKKISSSIDNFINELSL